MRIPHYPAEAAPSPHSPLLTAYEAGRWYALHGRALPAGATRETIAGYDRELDAVDARRARRGRAKGD